VPDAFNLKPQTDPREAQMPDLTFVVRGVAGAEDAEKLERALTGLGFVNLVNVDSEKGLVAVSFEGGEAEREKVEGAIGEAGHAFEPTPGADPEVG
jgi:copper chaperone CopZ